MLLIVGVNNLNVLLGMCFMMRDLAYITLLHGDPPHVVSANVANNLY